VIVPPCFWHPLWFGSLFDLPAPFVMMLLSCRSEFDALFSCGWVSRSLGGSDGLCRRSSSTSSLSRSLGQSIRWVVPSPFMWLNVSWRGSWLRLFFACA